MVPDRRQALLADIADGKAEAAAVDRDGLSVGIDHQHPRGVMTGPPDRHVRSPIIGLQGLEAGPLGLDQDRKRI